MASSWLDIAGSNSLATSNTMGASVGAGTIIFGNKNTGSGNLTSDITATPNVSQDGRMSTDTSATAATAKEGSSAQASRESTVTDWLSSPTATPYRLLWWVISIVGGGAVIVILFSILRKNNARRHVKKGRK